jgi:hypothetical protein
MQILAATLEQRLVGGITDQRMLELVGGIRSDTAYVDQFRVGQIAQRALQILFGDRMDRMEQSIGKLAANRCANLDDFFGRSQPVQPPSASRVRSRESRAR